MAQNWTNNDGLFLQYGTDKAIAEQAGEFLSYGANRVIEVLVDISTLTTTASILSNTTIFPAPPAGQLFIEKVEVVAETAVATVTSFSIGLQQMDRATIPASYSTAFVNAMTQSSMGTAGDSLTLTPGQSFVGGLVGTSPANATGPYYLTGLIAGSAGTGKVRVRIYYHGLPPITQ